MQIKHYSILEHADMAVIRAWVDVPDNRCFLITQGSVGSEIHSLCVHQPLQSTDTITLTENHLSGMIVETAWPE